MNKTLYVRHGRKVDLSAIADLFTTVSDVQGSRLEVIPESSKATLMGAWIDFTGMFSMVSLYL